MRKDMALVLTNEAQAGPVRGETGIEGLRLDFNAGLRLDVPEGNWRIRVEDGISRQVFFEGELSGDRLQSFEQYYVPWQISVWREGELIFQHRLDCSEQKICLYIDGHVPGMLPPLCASLCPGAWGPPGGTDRRSFGRFGRAVLPRAGYR